ncbi:MAG TPA: hypothetical protein VKR42_11730, partial [Ktedonobacteraceae bacterium]|nr:hypothetical protein [Ktedonobacteraceae bacterium]
IPFEQAVPTLAGNIRSAIALRYSQDCVDAYAGGYAAVYFLFASVDDTDRLLELIRNGIIALDLQPASTKYIEDSIRDFEAGKIPRQSLQMFFSLLGLYVMNFTTGSHPDISRFFEKDCLPLSNEATTQRILMLLNAVADSDKQDKQEQPTK